MLTRFSSARRGVAFDNDSRPFSAREILECARRISRSVSFDAAEGSANAFLASQLEYPNVELVKPLAAVTHVRDIPIKTGGGYVEFTSNWASDYATSGGNQYGLQGTQQTDIAVIQANIIKGTWPAFNWQSSMKLSYIDMKRLADAMANGIPAPYSLQQLLDEGVKLVWGKALDLVTYLGWAGQPGLINNSNVTSVAAPNGAQGSPLWTKKSPTEIQSDINAALLYTQENSGYDLEGLADTILLDYEHWSILNQPMTIGGFNSILEFILANNVARRQGVDLEILPLPDAWISAQGTGATNMMMAYKKSEKSLRLQIPQPIHKVMTVPTVSGGGAYETLFSGCIGVVQFLRPTTAVYYYGI